MKIQEINDSGCLQYQQSFSLVGLVSTVINIRELMLSRTLTRLFFRNSAHKEVHTYEIIAKMQNLRTQLKTEEAELEQLRKQVKVKEKETEEKNKILHQSRIKLTEDFKKAEQFWADAKKQSEANKAEVIRGFAASILQMNTHFIKTKQLETEAHSVDLREGFDNTVRLFSNTLEKFKIKKVNIKEGSKIVRKDHVIIAKEQKAENDQQKNHVAKVLEQGWEVEGKIIIKPKIVLYH